MPKIVRFGGCLT